MNILAHRGQWGNGIIQNSRESFVKAFKNGYGVETDLRDQCGDIVISHDMPDGSNISFSDFLEIFLELGSKECLALNVKADGLQTKVQHYLTYYKIPFDQYFVFDMSIPDTLAFRKLNMSYFSRLSEYEPILMLGDKARGIWVDIFENCWFDEAFLEKNIRAGYKLALVSPELHKREYLDTWGSWRTMIDNIHEKVDVSQIMICTDFPEEAAAFFNG